MTQDEALKVINDTLGIAADITHRGDEVKCYVPSTDGPGVSKTYFAAEDCSRLSLAFMSLTLGLHAATNAMVQSSTGEGK